VIMQASRGRGSTREKFLAHLIQAAIESYPAIPIAMHQDHGASLRFAKAASGSASPA